MLLSRMSDFMLYFLCQQDKIPSSFKDVEERTWRTDQYVAYFNSYSPLKWSNCTIAALRNTLEDDRGTCLFNLPKNVSKT